MTEQAPSLNLPSADAASIAYRSNLAEVRAFVRTHAAGIGLPPSRTGDLVIAASELAGNTFRHTSGSGVLQLWTAAGEVLCQVHDSRHITDPYAGRACPPPDASHGHGLWVARQLCDAVDISTSPSGTTICLHMQLDL